MNPIILPSINEWIVGNTWIFSLSEATSLGEGKLWFKPVKLRLKIDLVSYPAPSGGVGKYGDHPPSRDQELFTDDSYPK